MSERNEFDDLARRKLEEREFRFQEADWLDAQQLIAQQRSSGTWRTWLLASIGLVLIGTSVWFFTGDPVVEENAALSVVAPYAEDPSPQLPVNTVGEPNAIGNHGSNTTSGPTSSNDRPTNKVSTSSTGAIPSIDVARTNAKHEKVTGTRQQPPAEPTKAWVLDNGSTSPAPVINEVPQEPSNVSVAGKSSASLDRIIPNTTIHEEPFLAPMPGPSSPAITGPEANKADNGTGSEQPLPAKPGSSTTTAGTGSSTVTTANEMLMDAPVSTPQLNSGVPQFADTSTATSATSAPSSGPSAIQVQDSAATTAAIPQPLPLTATGSPWEIGVLFGGLLSRSTYSGSNSADWIDGQTGRWSPAFGGEVMHMGRNFGIGSGVHYSTYQEYLHTAERLLTTTAIQDSNYFRSFNTTVLYVLGNVIIDGEQYFVTETRDTTIDVLVLGTTSRTTTRKLIDMRDVTNRVSYIEVPLLLDAHVVQGAWAIGVRGGPTAGFLNGRRGAVPNASFDGYTDFDSEQFRSPVFGFTARAYLRYRCVNGWSVGVEPTWRGHFGNALSGGDLTRKSSALGGMISVSYRLR